MKLEALGLSLGDANAKLNRAASSLISAVADLQEASAHLSDAGETKLAGMIQGMADDADAVRDRAMTLRRTLQNKY